MAGKKTENTKTTKTNTKNQTNNKTIKRRKSIDRSLEVTFMNNTSGNFFYKCPKTQNIYDMYEYGDIDYITIDELLTMRNSHRKILNDLWILLIDVDDNEIELDEVLKFLGIDKLYNDIIKPSEIDGFITKSKDFKFKDVLKKMNKTLAKKVVERSIILYKQGKFNSISKSNILREFTKNEDLFE